MTYSDILGYIKTVEQAREFASDVDAVLDGLFKTQNNFDASLKGISAHNSETLKESMFKNSIDTKSQSMTKQYLEDLKNEVQKLRGIKIILAFDPPQKSIDNIFAWVAKNLGNGIILDIAVEKSILGGAIIEFEGKYEDLSLKKKSEKIFASKREEVLKTIT